MSVRERERERCDLRELRFHSSHRRMSAKSTCHRGRNTTHSHPIGPSLFFPFHIYVFVLLLPTPFYISQPPSLLPPDGAKQDSSRSHARDDLNCQIRQGEKISEYTIPVNHLNLIVIVYQVKRSKFFLRVKIHNS